ncbi:PQ loop repeat-domain-containing protein [Blyttiomyces helicus]|uniref:Cystinosin homolog n=1 Tax=Blyttiomyces helicus TaxID=388810 RepID=A0A4V1IQW8_9FUNG|nr:PQ loop repeat-domain-containing protein [Blyttiomyces helicus]|eukprot:RKO88007.1 PQ loop repeat-domain-containing protein [Blyttiomyces helicus]
MLHILNFETTWESLSRLVGWTYFVCWSVSFYPQVILNWRRKSVVGLSFDFLCLNFWGFSCYAVYNVALYTSPDVQRQYRERYGTDPLVQLNDVFFGVHAVIITAITLYQTTIYRNGGQKVSLWSWIFIIATSFAALVLGLASAAGGIATLDVIYYLSYVKMAVTLIKYTPQAYLNYQLKSTAGWSIGNIALDLTGGLLSDLQLLIDAYLTGDWSSVTGNPVKFSLGVISIIFDLLFITQHYVLYRDTRTHDELVAAEAGEWKPLLSGSADAETPVASSSLA